MSPRPSGVEHGGDGEQPLGVELRGEAVEGVGEEVFLARMDGHQQVDARAGLPGEHHAPGEELGVDLLQRAAGAPGFVELGEFVLGLVGERAFAWGTTGGSALSLCAPDQQDRPRSEFRVPDSVGRVPAARPGLPRAFGASPSVRPKSRPGGCPTAHRIEEAAGEAARRGKHQRRGSIVTEVFSPAIQVRAAAQECGEFFGVAGKSLVMTVQRSGRPGVFPLSFPVAPGNGCRHHFVGRRRDCPCWEEQGVSNGEIQRANRVGQCIPAIRR